MDELLSIPHFIHEFLTEIQKVGVIREFTLSPLRVNDDNLSTFTFAFETLVRNVNNALEYLNKPLKNTELRVCSDPKVLTPENETLQIDSASSIPAKVENTNSSARRESSKDLVQLQVDEDEVKRRINAFIKRKRKEIDEWNVQEFCNRPYVDEDNPISDQLESCARVDAHFFPRFGVKSRVKISRVENRWGPQTHIKPDPLPNAGDSTEDAQKKIAFEVIQERMKNMESHLNIETDPDLRCSIFQRLKGLEDRILFLESISPDYFHVSDAKGTTPRKNNNVDKERLYSGWSVDQIQNRIQVLKQSLKSKSKVKKEVTS